MDKLLNVNIAREMEKSFLDYSMSVIISRALPDIRDGLKPVHRRILYTMYESGYTPDKAYQKSAKTVGAVIGNYHPHGDYAVYDAMVRMAQDFSFRYVLVDGHGNFGSIDGYGAAAHRYTEARLSKISMELLRDINKETVDFEDNFDASRKEPMVLPSRYPNILVNGNMGIAVGMATNIPPHNLGEVIDGCIAYIDNNEISLLELMQHVKGPDFPTGAVILGNSGIKKAYETGKGSITIRSKAEIIEKNNRYDIVIKKIPYQVNKMALKQRIAELVRDKIIEGIADLRDESTLSDGIKIILELKKEANPNVVLNNLYKHSQLQTSYGINLLMLVDGQPKTLGLKDIFTNYVEYQKSVVYRRTKFDLDKAEQRAHILEGLRIALDHIDEIIAIIKSAKSDVEAKEKMSDRFNLTQIQSEAILEMKLRRLTGLERGKIEEELQALLQLIKELREILSDTNKILSIIKKEMLEIKDKYSDDRRTEIDTQSIDFIEDEALIPVEDIIITLTEKGYIKRVASDTYKAQNKGGVGIKGMTTNEEDFVKTLITMSTHDYLLFFTNRGKVYRIKGYEVPSFSRQAKGLPIVNLLPIEKEEQVTSVLSIKSDEREKQLIFGTRLGIVKRVELSEFENIRASGKIAITLKEDDELIGVKLGNGDHDVIMASSLGRMVRFKETEIRVMGRTASGVRGINLGNGICVGLEIASEGRDILVVTERGYGKRTDVSEYRVTSRGSKGVKTINTTDKNGNIVSFKAVDSSEDLIIVTNSGMLIRMPIVQIGQMSRVTQGVRLISLKEDQLVSAVFSVVHEEKEENETMEEEDAN